MHPHVSHRPEGLLRTSQNRQYAGITGTRWIDCMPRRARSKNMTSCRESLTWRERFLVELTIRPQMVLASQYLQSTPCRLACWGLISDCLPARPQPCNAVSLCTALGWLCLPLCHVATERADAMQFRGAKRHDKDSRDVPCVAGVCAERDEQRQRKGSERKWLKQECCGTKGFIRQPIWGKSSRLQAHRSVRPWLQIDEGIAIVTGARDSAAREGVLSTDHHGEMQLAGGSIQVSVSSCSELFLQLAWFHKLKQGLQESRGPQ